MSRAKMVAINGEKLKAHILTTGKTLADASEEMGYNRDYLNGCVRENKMSKQCIALIGLTFSIPQDLFVVKEEVPEPEPEVDLAFTVEDYLARIMRLLEEITEKMEVKENEQTTWNLPFGDFGNSSGTDDHAV